MKVALSLLPVLLSFSLAAGATQPNCTVYSEAGTSSIKLLANRTNEAVVGHFKVRVETNLDGGLVQASVEDLQSGVKANAQGSEEFLSVQLESPVESLAISCASAL